MELSMVPYGETGAGAAAAAGAGDGGGGGRGGGGKYRECMRNHAAAMGGHAYDGCGEFMPGGEGGSLEALKCAACGCHRNFHRREGSPGAAAVPPRRPLLLPPPPPAGFPAFLPHPMAVPYHHIRPPPPAPAPAPAPAGMYDGIRAGSETPPRREEEALQEGRRKRYRTKFTTEQKEKMHAFAEKLGWRIQKHDDVALQEFCVEIGVKRHVLKVWMHNNKSHLSASPAPADDASAPAPAPAPVPSASPTPISV